MVGHVRAIAGLRAHLLRPRGLRREGRPQGGDSATTTATTTNTASTTLDAPTSSTTGEATGTGTAPRPRRRAEPTGTTAVADDVDELTPPPSRPRAPPSSDFCDPQAVADTTAFTYVKKFDTGSRQGPAGLVLQRRRDEVMIMSFSGKARRFTTDGTPKGDVIDVPPEALPQLDGATYDAKLQRGLLINQGCVLNEVDPVTLASSSRRNSSASA